MINILTAQTAVILDLGTIGNISPGPVIGSGVKGKRGSHCKIFFWTK